MSKDIAPSGSEGESPFAITPTDDANVKFSARSIYVGGGGNLVLISRDGSQYTLNNFPAGQYTLAAFVQRVALTGTTATDLVGYP